MKLSILKLGNEIVSRMGMDIINDNDTYPHGTRVRNYCSNGYVSNIGNLTAKCAKGRWKPREPECGIGMTVLESIPDH